MVSAVIENQKLKKKNKLNPLKIKETRNYTNPSSSLLSCHLVMCPFSCRLIHLPHLPFFFVVVCVGSLDRMQVKKSVLKFIMKKEEINRVK